MASRQAHYSYQQSLRVEAETMRMQYQTSSMPVEYLQQMPGQMQGMPDQYLQQLPGGMVNMGNIMPIPDAKDCIAQIVLDWEFVHDLDLHLMKVVNHSSRQSMEPNPEPSPDPFASSGFNLSELVNPQTGDLALHSGFSLQEFVSYSKKAVAAAGGSGEPHQAVLQLDRNARVHSHKPVENCYLTRTLEPGVYAVKIHNYSMRRLDANVVPGRYRTWEEYTKMDPGYQEMEGSAKAQADHAADPETPEKVELMAKADASFQEGFQKIMPMTGSGAAADGVHYGCVIYTYPEHRHGDAKHPQAATLEELDNNVFPSEFFATSECIMEGIQPNGYNGGSTLANVLTEEGKLALGDKDEAVVALLKVVKDGDKSRLAEVKLVKGTPTRLGGAVAQPSVQSRHQAVLHRGQGGGLQRIVQQPQRQPVSAMPYGAPSGPCGSAWSVAEPQPEPGYQSLQSSFVMPAGQQLAQVCQPQAQPVQQVVVRSAPPAQGYGQLPAQPQLLRQVSPAQAGLPPQLLRQTSPYQASLGPRPVIRTGPPVVVSAVPALAHPQP